jgi:UPF0755 protein
MFSKAIADDKPVREEKEDMFQEDTLASIFGKRNAREKTATVSVPLKVDIKEKDEKPEPNIFEKTAVIDRTAIIKNIPASTPGNSIKRTDEADTDGPFRVDNPFGGKDVDELNSLSAEEHTEDTEEEGQPFYIENTELKRTERRRKRDYARERRVRILKAQQSRKTFAHLFGGILLVVFIVSASVFFSYHIIQAALDFTGITTNEFEIEVSIPPNATTDEIADILSEKGIISKPGFFVLYSQLFGFDGGYLDGMFMLNSSMTYSALINSLQSSASVRDTVRVTIPEGLTAEEIGRLLEESFVCLAEDFEQFYKSKQNVFSFERRVLSNSLKFHQLEGYLFPDTYEFFVVAALRDGKTADTMTSAERQTVLNYARIAANKFYDNFNSMITPNMYKTMNEKGFTLDELITLASMVQAEAATIDDKRYVASVFINRLENPVVFPHLQSDPTGYYARDFIKPHIPQRNLNLFQPIIDAYDTYISPGLPPGPINNPGIEAIMAVLEAPKSDYLYFCANLETREVFFATNLIDHNANLQRVSHEMGLTGLVR